jgi:hypothetical protein
MMASLLRIFFLFGFGNIITYSMALSKGSGCSQLQATGASASGNT